MLCHDREPVVTVSVGIRDSDIIMSFTEKIHTTAKIMMPHDIFY